MSKLVLGKGLGALIPGDEKKEAKEAAEKKYRMIPLDKIAPNPMQPRREFDQESLNSLAQSLKNNGLMQPLVIKKDGEDFTIIAGERRFRAARLAGMEEVPALLLDQVDRAKMLQLALVENVQREDLNAMETAEAYKKLIDEFQMTQNQIADQVGKSRPAVANTLRLNTLPEPIKVMLREGKLTEGHARGILQLDSEMAMLRLADRIVSDSLTVREVEQTASRKKRRRLIPKRKLPALIEIENYLKQLMGTSVKINAGLKRGKIEIEYYSDEDLERLVELFNKIEN